MKNFSLLCVEDDVNAQELIKLIVEDDIKQFYQAFDGEEGLKVYEKYRPDIVLTDINMPILNGLNMSKKIREIDDEQPIVIMSAFDDRDTLLDAIEVGISSFIPKPVDTVALMKKLCQITKDIQKKKDDEKSKNKKIKDLHDLAHYDVLTKIPNRFLFDVKFDEAIKRAKIEDSSFILFFIDLDNFKYINDTYGHACGDKVLQTVAKNIKKVIRKEDTFARISGDEFSLIAEDMDDENYINNLAQKILKATSTKIEFDGHDISITCSIGISRFPDDSDRKEDLLRMADTAMYEAKKLGKSKYFYTKGKANG